MSSHLSFAKNLKDLPLIFQIFGLACSLMFVIAALTNGVSTFKGIADLTNKESDRIKEMQKILNQITIMKSF